MVDFGTQTEREDALRIALACKELNAAVDAASFFVRVIDLNHDDPRKKSEMLIDCMERRTMILPAAVSTTPKGE